MKNADINSLGDKARAKMTGGKLPNIKEVARFVADIIHRPIDCLCDLRCCNFE